MRSKTLTAKRRANRGYKAKERGQKKSLKTDLENAKMALAWYQQWISIDTLCEATGLTLDRAVAMSDGMATEGWLLARELGGEK